MNKTLKHAALGGTFDLFHLGHQKLIDFAVSQAQKVTVGVVSDRLAIELGKTTYKNFGDRFREVEKYLQKLPAADYEIVPLKDIFGPLLWDASFDSIVSTKDNESNVKRILKERQRHGMKLLSVLNFQLLNDQDGFPISSTRIKSGSTDFMGNSYYAFLKNKSVYKLPSKLRFRISTIQGRLFKSENELIERVKIVHSKLISVGDESTLKFFKKGFIPQLSIIDFKIQKKLTGLKIKDIIGNVDVDIRETINPRGQITGDLIESIYDQIVKPKPSIIVVDGEEDLAVIPCVLLSPLGWKIVYGQRDKGCVLVVVDLNNKDKFKKILSRFS